jgi:hypothetical protein
LQKNHILDADELDDIFPSRRNNTQDIFNTNDREAPGLKMKHFKARLQSCEMRVEILMNELDSVKESTNTVRKKMSSVEAARRVLLHEREIVDKKILQLVEEKELIDAHLSEQNDKLEQVH